MGYCTPNNLAARVLYHIKDRFEGYLLFDIGDHLVHDHPFAVEPMEAKQLEIIEVIHPDMHHGHGDGIDDLDRDDLTLERLPGVFRALAVLDAIQVLGERLVIRLTLYIAEEQSIIIKSTSQQGNVTLINGLEIGIVQDSGDGCGVGAKIFHLDELFGCRLLGSSRQGYEKGEHNGGISHGCVFTKERRKCLPIT